MLEDFFCSMNLSIEKETTEPKPFEWDYHRGRQVSKGLALANPSFVKVYKADISKEWFEITVSFIINSINPIHTSGCSLQGMLCRLKMTLDLAKNLWISLHCQEVAEALFPVLMCVCKSQNAKNSPNVNTTFSPVLSVSLFSLYLSF